MAIRADSCSPFNEQVLYQDSPFAMYLQENCLDESPEPNGYCTASTVLSGTSKIMKAIHQAWIQSIRCHAPLTLSIIITTLLLYGVRERSCRIGALMLGSAVSMGLGIKRLLKYCIMYQSVHINNSIITLGTLAKKAITRIQEVEVVSHRNYGKDHTLSSLSQVKQHFEEASAERLKRMTETTMTCTTQLLVTAMYVDVREECSIIDVLQNDYGGNLPLSVLKEKQELMSLISSFYIDELDNMVERVDQAPWYSMCAQVFQQIPFTRQLGLYTAKLRQALQIYNEPVKFVVNDSCLYFGHESGTIKSCMQKLSLLEHHLWTMQIDVRLRLEELMTIDDVHITLSGIHARVEAMYTHMIHLQDLYQIAKESLNIQCDNTDLPFDTPEESIPLSSTPRDLDKNTILFDATVENMDDVNQNTESWIIEGCAEPRVREVLPRSERIRRQQEKHLVAAQQNAERLSSSLLLAELKSVVAAREFT